MLWVCYHCPCNVERSDARYVRNGTLTLNVCRVRHIIVNVLYLSDATCKKYRDSSSTEFKFRCLSTVFLEMANTLDGHLLKKNTSILK